VVLGGDRFAMVRLAAAGLRLGVIRIIDAMPL
jgi:hypothetical protein